MCVYCCCSWPAIVSSDPWCNNDFVCDEEDADGYIYHVEFLGKPPTHSWLPEEMVSAKKSRELVKFIFP